MNEISNKIKFIITVDQGFESAKSLELLKEKWSYYFGLKKNGNYKYSFKNNEKGESGHGYSAIFEYKGYLPDEESLISFASMLSRTLNNSLITYETNHPKYHGVVYAYHGVVYAYNGKIEKAEIIPSYGPCTISEYTEQNNETNSLKI